MSRAPDPSDRTRGKPLVFINVIQVEVLAFIAVALEVGHWLGSRRFPFNRTSGGERVTWKHPLELNRAGFREAECTPKAPRTWRILVLGDSITWGVSLARNERYTELIELALAKQFPDRDIKVLNLGKPELSTVEETELLQRWVEPRSPIRCW